MAGYRLYAGRLKVVAVDRDPHGRHQSLCYCLEKLGRSSVGLQACDGGDVYEDCEAVVRLQGREIEIGRWVNRLCDHIIYKDLYRYSSTIMMRSNRAFLSFFSKQTTVGSPRNIPFRLNRIARTNPPPEQDRNRSTITNPRPTEPGSIRNSSTTCHP
jgi:hypothetical protein